MSIEPINKNITSESQTTVITNTNTFPSTTNTSPSRKRPLNTEEDEEENYSDDSLINFHFKKKKANEQEIEKNTELDTESTQENYLSGREEILDTTASLYRPDTLFDDEEKSIDNDNNSCTCCQEPNNMGESYATYPNQNINNSGELYATYPNQNTSKSYVSYQYPRYNTYDSYVMYPRYTESYPNAYRHLTSQERFYRYRDNICSTSSYYTGPHVSYYESPSQYRATRQANGHMYTVYTSNNNDFWNNYQQQYYAYHKTLYDNYQRYMEQQRLTQRADETNIPENSEESQYIDVENLEQNDENTSYNIQTTDQCTQTDVIPIEILEDSENQKFTDSSTQTDKISTSEIMQLEKSINISKFAQKFANITDDKIKLMVFTNFENPYNKSFEGKISISIIDKEDLTKYQNAILSHEFNVFSY